MATLSRAAFGERKMQLVEVAKAYTYDEPATMFALAHDVLERYGSSQNNASMQATLSATWLHTREGDALHVHRRHAGAVHRDGRRGQLGFVYWWDGEVAREPDPRSARGTVAIAGSMSAKAREGATRPRGGPELAAVRDYLAELRSANARRGGPSPERVKARLEAIEQELPATDDPIRALELVNEQIRLRITLDIIGPDRMLALEESFVRHAGEFASRRGIVYAAWRAMGVPPGVLELAGIKPEQ